VPDRFESTCFARYAIVQYKAKAEYYLLYARYILEVQAEIPEDKLRQLLLGKLHAKLVHQSASFWLHKVHVNGGRDDQRRPFVPSIMSLARTTPGT